MIAITDGGFVSTKSGSSLVKVRNLYELAKFVGRRSSRCTICNIDPCVQIVGSRQQHFLKLNKRQYS